ncbi:MAG: phosphodiester glycosidase family protein [Chitinophagaceae bacterium]
MKRNCLNLSILLSGIVLIAVTSCSKSKDVYGGGTIPVDTVTITPPAAVVTLPAEWKKATSLMSGFPTGIEVYNNTTAYNGKTMNAYCVAFDPKNANIEFKPVVPTVNKKPSTMYAEESGTKYVCINGGFFGTNASYSLVQYNGTISAINIKSLTRTYNNTNATYYPTRGAFGLKADGTPDVTWVYHVGAGNGTLYSYPAPSPNALNSAPQAIPDVSFPSGGSVWNVQSAIGGSPILIKNNVVNVTDTAELIDIDNTSSRARSAIGFTSTGKVIILAVEGGNSAGAPGLTLREVAALMKSMGCTGALNLDGGGSTYMMVNGQATVKPSDAAGERAVMSAIVVKKK